MKLRPLCHTLLWTVPLWIYGAAPLHADVTVRYQTDMKMNLPGPAGEQAEKAMRASMGRWSNSSLLMKNGKLLSNMGSFGSILDSATQQMTLLDRDRKLFATFPAADFADKMSVLLPPKPKMPEEAEQLMARTKTTVTSNKTGRFETIQGIQAEEREVVIVMEMPNPASATSFSTRMVMSLWTPKPEETLRNQAVREMTGYQLYQNSLLNPAGMIQKMMANMPSQASFAEAIRDLSRNNSMMLRMRLEVYLQMSPEMAKVMAQADPGAPMSRVTQEVVELSTASIDEGVFRVPADFQAVEAEVLLKGLISDKMSAAVGAHAVTVKPAEEPGVAAMGPNAELMEQARNFSRQGEYSKAEELYRQILQSDPSNNEVKRLLASALFRQEKVDESVKLLNSISNGVNSR